MSRIGILGRGVAVAIALAMVGSVWAGSGSARPGSEGPGALVPESHSGVLPFGTDAGYVHGEVLVAFRGGPCSLSQHSEGNR